jgi:DNA-binding NtrC family response regulator
MRRLAIPPPPPASASTSSSEVPGSLLFLSPVAELHATNPFSPACVELQKAALRERYVPGDSAPPSRGGALSKNLARLSEPLETALARMASTLAHGVAGTPRELGIYQGAAIYCLWERYGERLQRIIDTDGVDVGFYDDFVEDHRFFFQHPGLTVPEPRHLLALFYQARRAWYLASTKIRGGSPSAMAVRASLWEASVSAEIGAYAEGLYRRMSRIPVLITGETGTGKDLAAECIGGSRYIPLDPSGRRFVARYAEDFHARSLCEIPRDLLESELFGHRRGTFTGATADKTGFFALPGEHGSLFLDEIGELPEHLQAKLLRPLQNREFLVIGDARPSKILGRLIFATHRDLEALCREGRFREDLLERMNGLRVHMPSLRRMLVESPGEMKGYVRGFVADTIDGPERIERWTERVLESIRTHEAGNPWRRNLRELKHYVERYVLSNGRDSRPPAPPETTPAAATPPADEAPDTPCAPSSEILGPRAKAGEITLDELTRSFVTRVHFLTGLNKAETARRLGCDARKVSRWLDRASLALGAKQKK